MLRNVLLAGLLAHAYGFSATPMSLGLRSGTATSARPQLTQVKMMDAETILVAAPSLIAAGALLMDRQQATAAAAPAAAAPSSSAPSSSAPAATSVSSTEMLNIARVSAHFLYHVHSVVLLRA
jgi:hypothetical protein